MPLLLSLLACSPRATNAGRPCEPLVVLAAADLQYALRAVVASPEVDASCPPALSFGSSGTFAAQIEAGAPADVFFSANESYVDDLEATGLVLADSRRSYAIGRIVLVGAPGGPPVASLADLAAPQVRHVAIANPDHAPYGLAARQALERSGLWGAVEPKLVFGANIAQTAELVRTGNADAGIIALSVALGADTAGVSSGGPTPHVPIGEELHEPLRQAAAVVARSEQPDAARAFLDLVTGPVGRPILERYGFSLPPAP